MFMNITKTAMECLLLALLQVVEENLQSLSLLTEVLERVNIMISC